MNLRDFLPFKQAPRSKRASVIDNEDKTMLARAIRAAALAVGFDQGFGYSARSDFEAPPYDFNSIQQAIDTDSYAKQAFAKYRELFWKEGWDLVSENQDAVEYLWERFDYMEIAMKQPFNAFLKEVADNLMRFHNVFIVKARDKKGVLKQLFPGRLTPMDDRGAILGFYIIPTETVEIKRDKHNRPMQYQQNMDNLHSFYKDNRKRPPRWPAKDVIHLSLDKKPGRAFGTPFMSASVDDLRSLRQIEEDILNLVHRELFPLFTFQIGTDEHPADQEEIDQAQNEVEGLRTEGALVMPHRHHVEMLGAEGNVLEAGDYLNHFKERAAVGLGVFPHHLGMSMGGGNRAMTDRLDVMLYDRVKEKQSEFADQIRFHILDELLREGGFDPTANPRMVGMSDRVMMQFNDIDQDTKVKKETHIIQKVAAGLETIPEGRLELGMSPEMDESETATAQQVRLQPTVQTLPGKKTATGSTTEPKLVDTTPAAAQKPSSGGSPNAKSTGSRGASNVVRPTNQYGTRTSPNIRRSEDDENWLTEVVDILGDDYGTMRESNNDD